MAEVSVIGAGSWGEALAILLADNGHDVTMWSALEYEVDMINNDRENPEKLPGVKIPENVKATKNLEEALKEKELVVLAVPSKFTRSTAHQMAQYVKDGQIIVNVAKGIEESTLMTLSEVIEDEIKNADVAVLSGPSHAEEVGRRIPTSCVAGAKTKKTAEYIQNIFMNEVFRVYTNPDILGIEIGASLKNVIALAAGMADGLGYGDNSKAALITRGIAEISRLGVKMGGAPETFYGLSGIGDLIVTCASMHSRNRRAGILIGKGYTAKEAMEEVKMIVEGVYCTKAAVKLSEKYGIAMPIVSEVEKILFDDKPAKDAVKDLMLRGKKSEHTSAVWRD
ncbi:glycerol 3-phosphate dehydrogenase (NAD(P)+) [Acetitomaculum ruminis DSM 5522]|uniref:Glycerol-3-phosphate dehydrogenase [NAD(P)+] n=1 Tax=Acetitomaculum ruminis DSM 5522 TaxID=1120918 RepID=A0A1I0VN04_9FIRM|nr:NAD(P)H-dependent glycerol-3-phosphate dehydrogenase [Acetitomaculum ruminis]SFA77795.1 glycerol 3-phosphate dehydrogenase (NAD(P)+) [Acetitomaculum ruminis DSM 5522]